VLLISTSPLKKVMVPFLQAAGEGGDKQQQQQDGRSAACQEGPCISN
jgi:hypothetical protein